LARAVADGSGELTTRAGRTAFSVAALPGGEHVLVFVPVSGASEGAPALVQALLALTTLLIGVAAVVAFGVARDAEHDVLFVSRRVLGMALVRTEPAGEPVPVRTMDEVGALTSAFNDLVARFAAAEARFHGDLARASAADRDRAAFLAAMSHELRTPLHAILGFADVLLKEVDGPLPADAREEVEQIRESGVHLNGLIEDILSFSALESGQLRLHEAEVNLLVIAQELVRQTSVVVAGRPLRVRLEGGPVYAWADAKRVRQLLGNLVGNAVKFTEKGEVVVTLGRRGAFAVVTVKDTGPGIAKAEHAHVFEEYRQAAAERKKRRGTGLGLAIAQRLAVAHGGSIELDSDVGRGSTFTVLLPLAPRELQS
jgi:signal transduction histidine kinase